MLVGEQSFPVWESFGAVEDATRALCLEPPLPPYAVVDDAHDWLVWTFDSLDAAIEFACASASWGFTSIVTTTAALLPMQRKALRERRQ